MIYVILRHLHFLCPTLSSAHWLIDATWRRVFTITDVHSAYHPVDDQKGSTLQRDAQTDACVKLVRTMQRKGCKPDDICVSAALTTYTTSSSFTKWMLSAIAKHGSVAEGVRSWTKQLPGLCFLGARPTGSSLLCRHQASLNARKVYGVMAMLDLHVKGGMITPTDLATALASDLMYPHVKNVLSELEMLRMDVDHDSSVVSSTNVSTMWRAVGTGSRAKWLQDTSDSLKSLWREEAARSKSVEKRKWCLQCAEHTNPESTAWNICKVTSVVGVATGSTTKRRKKFKGVHLKVRPAIVRKIKAKQRRVARGGA